MPTDDDLPAHASASLLQADEPAPFTLLNDESDRPVLLLCDHASRRFPRAVRDLGLDQTVRGSHLAVDIGAAAVSRHLAASLSATTVLAGYSRLVVDCNRGVDDPETFLQFSDGMRIPGNHGLTEAQKKARVEALYQPYHQAVHEQVERLGVDATPAILAMHSFTPVFEGAPRPWEIGVLWDRDDRIAAPLMDALREAKFVVGDNKPYVGTGSRNYTLNRHARAAGLPNVAIEVRQDLIDHAAGVERIASALHDFIVSMPASVDSFDKTTARAGLM